MSFLRKLLGRPEPIPEWARFFPPGAFPEFMALLKQDLGSRAIPFKLDAREGTVAVQNNGQSHTLGLLNLAQHCAR
jgi:hypothetical protein